jgi:hypothetical protein
VRSSNEFDNNNTEKKQDKTETLKTQIASVALSALRLDTNLEKLTTPSNNNKNNNNNNNHQNQQQQQQQLITTPVETPKKQERNKVPPNRLALAPLEPPPVPKRNLQTKNFLNSENIINTRVSTRTEKVQSKSLSDVDNKLDCANDLCSISFDDIGDSDDLVIFDKKLDANQSSSDSSRSQTTIDTGYISAFEADRSSVSTHQRQFRSRFSSEDTQSSLDSYLSSDLQRADTIDSLHSNFTDSPFVLKKNVNVFNFDQNRLIKKISSSGSIDSDNNKSISTPNKTFGLRRPVVPARKGIRPPPIPPLRASQLADISKSVIYIHEILFF